MAGEKHHVAYLALDLVIVTFANEELLKTFGAHVRFNGSGIDALTGKCNRPLVQVGGENLDVAMDGLPFRLLEEQHRYPIRFLSGGTTDRPDTQSLVFPPVLEQLRDDRFLEHLPGDAVPEEVRHADQDIVEQGMRFVGVVPEIV